MLTLNYWHEISVSTVWLSPLSSLSVLCDPPQPPPRWPWGVQSHPELLPNVSLGAWELQRRSAVHRDSGCCHACWCGCKLGHGRDGCSQLLWVWSGCVIPKSSPPALPMAMILTKACLDLVRDLGEEAPMEKSAVLPSTAPNTPSFFITPGHEEWIPWRGHSAHIWLSLLGFAACVQAWLVVPWGWVEWSWWAVVMSCGTCQAVSPPMCWFPIAGPTGCHPWASWTMNLLTTRSAGFGATSLPACSSSS